jgi:multidrug transporter EmrE-like cation transporter
MNDMNYLIAVVVVVILLYVLPFLFKLAVVGIAVGVGFLIWTGYGEVIKTFFKEHFTKPGRDETD